LIMLPSETMIWQPEFTDKTLSRKPGTVQTDGHIEQIMQVFASKTDVDHLAKTVPQETVAANNYNLSVSSYVEAKDNREIINIAELNAELKTTVSKIDQLRKDIDAIVAEIEGCEVQK
ncbi:N-6 DNA methylase, partial [Escherichia coli]|uniref:N-6 DNA methylase n=1 Tax=Escherichia coli TaxID=562 RepID=UPI0012FF713C